MKLKRVTTREGGHEVYISYMYDGKRVYYDLYHVDEYDTKTYKPKKGCNLYRVHSDNTNMYFIVSINLDNNRIYFLIDYNEEPPNGLFSEKNVWEKRGIKLDFNLKNLL